MPSLCCCDVDVRSVPAHSSDKTIARFLGSTVFVSLLGIASTFSPSSLRGLALRGGRRYLSINARESEDFGFDSVSSILHKHSVRVKTLGSYEHWERSGLQ